MTVAILFCHTDGNPSVDLVQSELHRQYQHLYQYAAMNGLDIAGCVFHTGTLNYEHPDDVLLRFMEQIQLNSSSIVIAETRDFFPLSQYPFIPLMKAYFLREQMRVSVGSKEAPIRSITKSHNGKAFFYRNRQKQSKNLETR